MRATVAQGPSTEYDFGFGLKAKATFAYGYSVYLWECFEFTYDAYTYDRLTDTYNVVPGGGNKNPFETRRRLSRINSDSYS